MAIDSAIPAARLPLIETTREPNRIRTDLRECAERSPIVIVEIAYRRP